MKKKLFSILPLIALGSCATQIDVDPLVETPEIQQQIEKVESTSSAIPDWFKELPEDDKMIYSSGTAIAPDLQLSVDIATMNAKTVLADRINGKLDSMTKQFIAKTGTTDLDSQVLNELERVSKNVIASVDVAGYKIKDMEVYPAGTQYRSFVLLEYSDEEAIKILMNRMRKDRAVYAKLRSNNAFKELERSVDKSLNQDEVQSLSNIEKELDDLSDNINKGVNERYIDTVPAIGPDQWMTE
tara:strand:- start:1904 stop:2629 length:726 start_codon:yes stop_codon:yes gene_type:complete